MGYIRSSPSPAIEVETAFPPLHIRYRWLAGIFLLKYLSHSNHLIFDIYHSLFFSWRYVPKSMTILSFAANSIPPFSQFILNAPKLPPYDQSYDSLFSAPIIHITHTFLNLSSNDLKSMSHSIVNNIFVDYLNANFPNFTVVYTDGSVTPTSAGYSVYIPALLFSFLITYLRYLLLLLPNAMPSLKPYN